MSASGEDTEDAEIEIVEDGYDESAHQGCYVFRTADPGTEELCNRPTKRRKVSKPEHVDRERLQYPRLGAGREPEAFARLRQTSFEKLWSAHQSEINKVIAKPNSDFIESIARFVRHVPKVQPDSKLPTGLVVVGKDGGSQQRLLHQWQSDERTKPSEYLIQVDHNQAANITSALKSIIRSVISSSLGQAGYLDFLSKHRPLIPMNYDLELLYRFTEEKEVEKVVISVLDVEAFDIVVLSDMIRMLASWTDRIPFVLLIGISTTIELFEARLPKATIRHLLPVAFEASGDAFNPMYKIFMATQQSVETDGRIWLGPAAANALLEKSQEQGTTPETFGRTIKYAYMSHFFVNSLSILATSDLDLEKESQALICDSVRNTPSFMEYVETLLDTRGRHKVNIQEVTRLLNDDGHLMETLRTQVAEGQARMQTHYEAVAALKSIIVHLRHSIATQQQPQPKPQPGTASTRADSVPEDIFDATVLALAGPDAVDMILDNLHLHETLSTTSTATHDNLLHSEHIFGALASSLRAESLHADLITSLSTTLKATLVDPTTLPFHEIFIYNAKTPLASAVTPTPRYALERALSRPADYLACECCAAGSGGGGLGGGEGEGKLQNFPPAAVFWRLWCEAGGVVNVRDLWEAFRGAVVLDAEDEDDEQDEEGDEEEEKKERRALALFYRSLAEMKMLGLLKASKRKPGVECLGKVVWAGM